MLDFRIQVGPIVGASRICTTYKKPSDAKEADGSRPQERRVRTAISLSLFGTAVTIVAASTCSSGGHHE